MSGNAMECDAPVFHRNKVRDLIAEMKTISHTTDGVRCDPSEVVRMVASGDSKIHMSRDTKRNGNSDRIVAGAAASIRPSTARRTENLRALIAELAVREMGYAAVAKHLNCSASSARNYISEMLDLGLVVASSFRPPAGAIDRQVFRLNSKRPGLATLDCIVGKQLDWESKSRAQSFDPLGSLLQEKVALFSRLVSVSAWRDPLVTALFGPPNSSNQPPDKE